jgi:3-hydroxyacyl-CoA dehydrogenase
MEFEKVDGIGVVTINSPPVNALGLGVRQGIIAGLQAAIAADDVKAIIIICAGRTFFAGADITEFGKTPVEPHLHAVFNVIENSPKYVVAAIHGTALGGGLELALNCHYRIAVPSAIVGLPEVSLGLLPGAGGTQRIPRIIGIEAALDFITSGKPMKAKLAKEVGIIDAVVGEETLKSDAIAFAKNLILTNAPMLKVRDRNEKVAHYQGNSQVFDEYRKKNARAFRGFKAQENIIKCIEASANLPFDEGMEFERKMFFELLTSSESAAQRHVFFAGRETSKIPNLPNDIQNREIKRAGVIGAGTMGGGICMNYLNIGLPVVLVEQTQAALDRGIGIIRKNYENTAQKGKITAEQVEARMALITPSLDYASLSDCDIITEAVFESMAVKLEVFKKIDAVAKPNAILASNTSFLSIDEIAAATSRPNDVVGNHYFSPANVMPLLEIVRGAKTDNSVLSTSLALAKKMGKTPVVSGVCFGFIANRAMSKRSEQCNMMILEGVSPELIDKVGYDYGFAMGPFKMADLVGLDVTGRDSNELTVRGELVRLGRLGQKSGGGFYDYDENRNAILSPIAMEVIADVAQKLGVAQRPNQSEEEILARMLYPVINECSKIVEEGIAYRPSDVDIAMIFGYNWPVYRGGPMFWADLIGLNKIASKLNEYAALYGDSHSPSALLLKLAEENGTFGKLNRK